MLLSIDHAQHIPEYSDIGKVIGPYLINLKSQAQISDLSGIHFMIYKRCSADIGDLIAKRLSFPCKFLSLQHGKGSDGSFGIRSITEFRKSLVYRINADLFNLRKP